MPPEEPGTVQLLARGRLERVRRIAGMRESRVGCSADALPRRRLELEAAEVAVTGVGRPGTFLHVNALRLKQPRRRRAPFCRGGGPGEQKGGEAGDEHGAHDPGFLPIWEREGSRCRPLRVT